MARTRRPKEDRIFVEQGRRHYRPAYSLTEFRIGAVILVLLAALLGWVAWRGAHPDPELYSSDLVPGETAPEGASKGAVPVGGEPLAASPYSAGGGGAAYGEPAYDEAAAAPASDRGPLPADLAPAGWREGPVSSFDGSTLYEKINGREGYYKGFGFQRLHFVSLTAESDEGLFIDIECFDQGTAENALGAYTGERSPSIAPAEDEGGLSHIDRNALYVARGKYYVRAIGSDESAAVRSALDSVRETLLRSIRGEDLPWAYALFGEHMGIPSDRIAYEAENAFSLEFADEVYSALLEDGETELFAVRASAPEAAAALAGQFNAAFADYGEPAGLLDGVSFAKDRYLGSLSGATSEGPWVFGIRGAPDEPAARASLERLRDAVAALAKGNTRP